MVVAVPQVWDYGTDAELRPRSPEASPARFRGGSVLFSRPARERKGCGAYATRGRVLANAARSSHVSLSPTWKLIERL